jgi:UrcA family protein
MNTNAAFWTTMRRATLLAAVAALAPVALMAQTPSAKAPEVAAAKVSFNDLDLSSAAGQRAAKDRVLAAAHTLCNRFSDTRRVDNGANMEACNRDAAGIALQQLSAKLAVAAPAASQVAINLP